MNYGEERPTAKSAFWRSRPPCGNERTPFWMSKRERDVAAEKGDIYRVRRVFHFRSLCDCVSKETPPSPAGFQLGDLLYPVTGTNL
jgi:hypothetical protein